MIHTFADKSDIPLAISLVQQNSKFISALEIDVTEKYTLTSDLVEKILTDTKHPVAIEPNFIASRTSESDKYGRAEAIVEQFVDEPLAGKRVLDMGCGEGHIAAEMARRGAQVVAYDTDPLAYTQQGMERLHRAESLDDVRARGPYDLILLFDVLDHSVSTPPGQVLRFCNEVLAGHIKVRFHPWCSRHGTHLFHSVNKAYLHMFATDEELAGEGFVFLPTIKVIHPKYTYSQWITEAGLKSLRGEIHREVVEPMFAKEPYRSRIVAHWRDSPIDESLRRGDGWPEYAMEVAFIDHTLVKKPDA